MVVLYGARHRLRVPALARWLLALGIAATLAANVAHGWPGGPIGAVVAAWPASLVGSYELLLWLIRTGAAGAVAREGDPVQPGEPADQPAAHQQMLPFTGPVSGGLASVYRGEAVPAVLNGGSANPTAVVARTRGPEWSALGSADHPLGQVADDRSKASGSCPAAEGEDNVNATAVAAYRTSIENGKPLSERKLAAMFGKISRRWARNRMAEAR
jgi:hypothetical protein